MAAPVTVYVCSTCRAASDDPDGPRAGARLAAALRRKARRGATDVIVSPVECLSVCKRPVTVAFASPGRWTYVYGDFDAEAADEILAAAALYGETEDGLIPWRQRPEPLKRGVVARLPPSSNSSGTDS